MERLLTVSIDPQLFPRFPALKVGGFLVTSLNRASAAITADDVEELWASTVESLARGGVTTSNVAAMPSVQRWREAFAACGLPPSAYTNPVEALVRRVLSDGRIRSTVRVVALYTAIAVRHLAPLGGYDLDALPTTSIAVRPARPGSDWFVPLGARPTDVPLQHRVIVCAADRTVLSWSFHHRDSRQACLRRETSHAVFFSEAVTAAHAKAAASALTELRAFLAARGARAGRVTFADMNSPGVALTLDAAEVGV